MDEKISLEAIALYGDAYTEKILDGFFSSKDKISGSEILSLCNVQQVNLFVIRELFKTWKGETKNLKSPYFAYDNPDVKEALENLMSVLSKNISIDRRHFEPLLKKAVSQTLLVVFDPYDFFAMIITGQDNKLEIAPFKEEIRYLKVNKAPLERMLQKLEEKGVSEISGNEAFSILDQILEEVSFNPEDVEEYLEKFSAVLTLDANSFYVAKPQQPTIVKPVVVVPEPKVEKEKVQDTVKEYSKPATPAPQPAQASTSINETMTRPGRPSIVDNFQKIAKIKDSLTINQKFMFTKVLFHGDFELFSKAIDHLDKLDNIKSALRYIENEHAGAWDNESEEFHEFMELIEKRFG
jgi:hypothetical protein